jgi:Ca-activated chloride channel family protein
VGGRETLVGFKLRTLLSLVAAAVAASLATIAAMSVGAARPTLPWLRSNLCTQVDVVASSEKAALMSAIADDFDRSGALQDGTCVHLRVHGMDSGAAEGALARGWDAQLDGGYLPTVWTPAATAWLSLLDEAGVEQGRPQQHLPPDGGVTSTPLVLAMPRPMAVALGWPNRGIGWSDVLGLASDPAGWARLGHPEWGAFRLGKTDPDLSTSGLHALIETYFAATGLARGLTPDDVESPATVSYVARIEQATVHYGNTTLTFLANLLAADDAGQALSYISAVAVEEKSVWDYNHGNPSGDPATLDAHGPPHVPLVAVYPKEGTLFSDSPYAVLQAPWVTARQQAAAHLFFRYLRDPERQARFERVGYRSASADASVDPGAEITFANGLLSGQPQRTVEPPRPPILAQIQADWTRLRKRARLLVVLDTSRAMADPLPGAGGATRFDVARRAVLATLAELAPDDEVGMATFPAGAGDPALDVLVPVAPAGQVGELIRATTFGSVDLTTRSPLYGAIGQAVDAMSANGSYDANRINAVLLLTDGADDSTSGVDRSQLLDRLRRTGEERNVPVFAIAYGGPAETATLDAIAAASRGRTYPAAGGGSVDDVFTQVVGNF